MEPKNEGCEGIQTGRSSRPTGSEDVTHHAERNGRKEDGEDRGMTTIRVPAGEGGQGGILRVVRKHCRGTGGHQEYKITRKRTKIQAGKVNGSACGKK